ncbi:hypothetical protein OD91_1973 [Lutibacter sp. Hel_I_33_5]|uniref:hypothetical protein n=1 Tax=Lutibacter sp. Hel_I_33_5 TaxID=1566289 RepID=UPI0011A0A2A3|nr:hypothetical protein [Lutibacter sp. Hel_I_33_5]TVZ56677.1 hypothetical protein OD91_1973 [Lutibacter sp. Hel_I_33_5]
MRFHKIISVILHPIVIPTIGVLLYFLLVPNTIQKQLQLTILGLVFVVTYLIPVLLLAVLKAIGSIESYHVTTIKERKIPLAFMMVLFYLLGSTLIKLRSVSDLGILFYATSLGIVLVYVLFLTKLKTSLHLLSMGIAVGFFLLIQNNYGISFFPIIAVSILFSGLLGSARLHLKAHTPFEVYSGFIIGFLCPYFVNAFL